MNTIIKYLKLPFTFSPEKLQAELKTISENWILHYNTKDYEGEWSALPLRSIKGSMTHVVAVNSDVSEFADTPLMAQCPYMKSIVDQFDCGHMSIRLLKLKAGAVIKEHKDGDLGYEMGEVRIHVPILTDPAVEFYSEDERIDMQEGECWYVNFDLPHRINNFSTKDRVHLVMDMRVSDALKDMFDNADPAFKKMVPAKSRLRAEDRPAIIEQLLAMNTPMSLELAEKMKAEMT